MAHRFKLTTVLAVEKTSNLVIFLILHWFLSVKRHTIQGGLTAKYIDIIDVSSLNTLYMCVLLLYFSSATLSGSLSHYFQDTEVKIIRIKLMIFSTYTEESRPLFELLKILDIYELNTYTPDSNFHVFISP